MFERPSRASRGLVGASPDNPMSFFAISNLYTIKESDVRSQRMSLEQIEEEVSSTRSSVITALPRWESIKNPGRPRLPVPPLPIIPKRGHVRQGSQAPILEKANPTEEDVLESAGLKRAGSNGSRRRSGASTPADSEHPRHSRMMIWLVLILVIVLALAIILGAVLGTFVNPSHSGPQPSVTEIPAGTTPTPTTLPGGSGESPSPIPTPHLASAAVTGWSVPGPQGYFTVWLYWQNSQGYLSRAAFNSSTGNWTRVSNFAEAKRGTPLTAAALNVEYYEGQENYSFPLTRYQTSVVYLDDKNYLSEWIFPDAGPEVGQPGSLSEQKYMAHEETRLGFYWPQLVYQGLSGELRGAYFECHRKDQCWHEMVFRTTAASNGTQLVTVPMLNNLSSTGLFYEEESSRYVNYKEDRSQMSQIWENQAFSNLIPSTSSIAAFSTTRSRDPKESKLNTYLLWQDNNGTIQMSWTDNDEGWKGPITHPAFAGADKNTALTCLTGLTFPDFPLAAGTELARCYFQTGLALREVSFDGESWDIVGIVPIDF